MLLYNPYKVAITLRKLAPSIYRDFFSCKYWKFHWKNFHIFNIFAQNIDCGYTLEPPSRRFKGHVILMENIMKTAALLHKNWHNLEMHQSLVTMFPHSEANRLAGSFHFLSTKSLLKDNAHRFPDLLR